MKTYNYVIKNADMIKDINFDAFKTENNILVQIFCGRNLQEFKQVVNFITKALPNASCLGSTTDGEICEHKVYQKQIIINISVFKATSLVCDFVDTNDSFKNGQKLAKKLLRKNTKLLILFAEFINTLGEDFLKGVSKENNKVLVAGAIAGDNGKFQNTYISCGKKILKSGAVGVSLNSDVLNVVNGYRFNWIRVGLKHTIQKVENSRIYSIGGLSAYEFYKKYLGEEVAKSLPVAGIEYPLIINRNGIYIARSVTHKHNDGSLSFSGNFNEKESVRLAFGDVETILQNSIDLSLEINKLNIESFFIYSCMARRRYMPKSIHKEIEPFANKATTSGFFTYGEFFHQKGHNELLNQALTFVGLSESSHKVKNDIKPKKSNVSNLKHLSIIKALTHLIEETSRDFAKQTETLEAQKQYTQELLNAQNLFIRQSLHETNTPLNIIMNSIEFYKNEFAQNEHIDKIEAALMNISNIYDDLSYIIMQNHISQNKHFVNIVDFIGNRIEFFKPLAKQVRLSFKLTCNQKSVFIKFNQTKLQRIVDNNLANAIKYSKENNIIKIQIIAKNDICTFSIISISHKIEDKNKIFEEYYRENLKTKGFGLGLNLVKRICDENDVKIQISSTKKRTIFSYEFAIEGA